MFFFYSEIRREIAHPHVIQTLVIILQKNLFLNEGFFYLTTKFILRDKLNRKDFLRVFE